MVDKKEAEAAVGVSLSSNISENTNLVLQTHLPQDMPYTDMLKVHFKLDDVAYTMQARHELRKLEEDLETHIVTRKRSLEDIQRVKSNSDILLGSTRVNAKAKDEQAKNEVAYQNALANIARFDEEIGRIKSKIEAKKAIIHGTSSSTNSEPGNSNS